MQKHGNVTDRKPRLRALRRIPAQTRLKAKVKHRELGETSCPGPFEGGKCQLTLGVEPTTFTPLWKVQAAPELLWLLLLHGHRNGSSLRQVTNLRWAEEFEMSFRIVKLHLMLLISIFNFKP